MRPMRKLEAENILPESETALEVRDGDAGVIGGNDAKRRSAHVVRYPGAAITLSSIAIGVGNAVTSMVVRVGFGLPSPAKYSA